MVLKCFYEKKRLKYDRLNIVVILAPSMEFFSAKCIQCPFMTFMTFNVSQFWDTFFQEIHVKSYLNAVIL